MDDIIRLKAFAYAPCTVRICFGTHKHKLCAHDTPKQTYMLFQNDVAIDLASHSSNLNMQVSSGTRKNYHPFFNQQSCTTVTVSFNDFLLVVTGNWRSQYESPMRIRLQAKPGLVGKHHISPLWWCPHNACSILQANCR
ncbi:uncharacterized protein TNCV_3402751 [Trichonephila clavipes]|nr:uncharacterized protein TNCV_3402751 [Trichonephila clavipes]